MSFLPHDYEAPRGAGNYMKLQTGENRVRILSQPILGWEDWTEDKKPVRYRFENKPAKPINATRPVRHFWAMVVWNYAEERIQVLQVSQAGVRNGIEKYAKDADWGAPWHYDIKITKRGEGKDTEYGVISSPKAAVAAHIKLAFDNTPVWLDAMFEGGDPFAPAAQRTPGQFGDASPLVGSVTAPKANSDQLFDLRQTFSVCSEKTRSNILEYLRREGVGADFAGVTNDQAIALMKVMAKDPEAQLAAAGF